MTKAQRNAIIERERERRLKARRAACRAAMRRYRERLRVADAADREARIYEDIT